MTGPFEGRTALITGGGSGVGRATALALAAEGCLVTVCGRTASTLEETVGLVEAAGGAARFVRCDVSDERSVQDAVEAAIGDAGRLDFGVNSAGVSGGDALEPTAGATLVSAPADAIRPGFRYAYVKDPEGNLIELIQPAASRSSA